jgi:imidazolonepropionase-like amidohydrolase
MSTVYIRLSLAAAIGVQIVVAGPFSRQIESAQITSGAFLIANVRVFDGERIRSSMNVAVEDGIISAVESNADRWRRLPAIDGAGATLLPGLIDAHTHPEGAAALQESLRFGVTTVLGMGVVTTADEGAVRTAAATRLDVADYRSAGTPATAPGALEAFGPASAVAGPADAEAFVAARKSGGSHHLKISLNGVRTAREGTPNLGEDTVRALVRSAHARAMLVVAHIESIEDVRVALASGVDGLAHLWREDRPADEMIRRIVAQRVFVTPTAVIPDAMVAGTGAALTADPRLQPFLTATLRERLIRPPLGIVLPDITWRLAAIGRLHAAGARLLTGSDADDLTRSASGVHLHRELELLVKSGLTPSDALAAATANVADAFRLDDRGRIAVGRRADLLLVRGDPTVDITATRDILRVWRSGVEFDRSLRR